MAEGNRRKVEGEGRKVGGRREPKRREKGSLRTGEVRREKRGSEN